MFDCSYKLRYVIYTGSKPETIRICKERNILKQYLSSRKVEAVTIMMSLFDDKQIVRTYAEDMARETTKKNAITMLKKEN